MVYKLKEGKDASKVLSKYLNGEMFFVIYISRVGFVAVPKEVIELKKKKKKIYHAERYIDVFDSDASIFRRIQGSSEGQGKKVRKKYTVGIESNISIVGTDNYFRWLSEVDRYYNGE